MLAASRRRRGGVATQRPAKPCTPVRFWSAPLKEARLTRRFRRLSVQLHLLPHLQRTSESAPVHGKRYSAACSARDSWTGVSKGALGDATAPHRKAEAREQVSARPTNRTDVMPVPTPHRAIVAELDGVPVTERPQPNAKRPSDECSSQHRRSMAGAAGCRKADAPRFPGEL